MCGLYAHKNQNYDPTYETIFSSKRPLPNDSTKKSLVFLYVGLNFINTCLKVLANNFHVVAVSINKRILKNIYLLKNQPQLLNTSKENDRHF